MTCRATSTPDAASASAGLTRRSVLRGLAAALAAWPVAGATGAGDAGAASAGTTVRAASPVDPRTGATLEAFADTLIPGQKRRRDDRAVAGAAPGPGAVHAGVLDLLDMPEAQVRDYLPAVATALDAQATAWAASHGRVLDPVVPPFVALAFDERTAVVSGLLAPDGPHLPAADAPDVDRALFTLFALLTFVAFDTAGHRRTVEAVRDGHPGLAWLRFPTPDADGLWRYEAFSYTRPLARTHPATSSTGSPA